MPVLKIKNNGVWEDISGASSQKNITDTTLTQEGVAADAKAVGEALDGKAPVGNYATESFVTNKIAEAQLGGDGSDIDLSGYATKDDLNAIDFPVDSVNGKSGAVELSAEDVGATPASHTTNKNNPHGVTIEQIGAAPIINIGTFTGDIDSITDLPLNSVAWITPNTVGNPTSSYGCIETWGSAIGTRNQRIATRSGNVVERLRYNSAWTEWEWVNPPMEVGVEYRTAERHNGKVVYAKAVKLGALTNGVSTVFTEAYYLGAVRVAATAGGYLAPFYLNGVLDFAVTAQPTSNGVHVECYSKGTLNGQTTTVILWYTKS